jgi:hypothetical protein
MDVSITTDTAGALYIGYTSTTVRVQKLNADRDLEWSITIDNTDGWSRPYLAVDSEGVVYMAYEIAADGEVCVAKLAADGSTYLWNRSYGDLGTESSAKLAIDGSGNVILVFATTGEISGGTTAGGGSDVAVFKLNPDGDVLWSLQHPSLNTPGQDTEPAVTVAPSGALLVSYLTTDSPAEVVTASIASSANVTWTRRYPETMIPCFLAETPVRTRRGVVPIREVVVGDEVMASRCDSGWVTVRRVSVTPTVASPATAPYIVPRGWRPTPGVRRKALERFFISPNHCVAVPGQGMVRASELGLRRSERFRDGEVFLYYNLEVDGWENIVVCGVEVESLAPNRVARMPVAQLLAGLIQQYGGVDRIPYEKCFKRIRLEEGTGTAVVPLLSKEVLARRAAVAQALA